MQPVDVGFDDSEFGEGSRLDDANCSVIEVLEGIGRGYENWTN